MRLNHTKLLLTGLLLALAPSALASTTWYVNGLSGSDSNNCKSPTTACKTIGHSISLASSGDSIMVASATYTENLAISISLNVIGAGASTTIVDGGGVDSVVRILPTTTVVLSGLTIRNGKAANGGGISNGGTLTINNSAISGNVAWLGLGSGGDGGGISNGGTLTIYNSAVSGNFADGSCKLFQARHGFVIKCFGGLGGGISNRGTLTIGNSTISGNVAQCDTNFQCLTPWLGGGIYHNTLTGTLSINNSTISGNRLVAAVQVLATSGGGIYSLDPLTINNSTISGNSAGAGGGIGGNNGVATLQNNIVANNQGGNCSGPPTSNGYNLSSDGTCNFSNSGDRNNLDPLLGPPQYNGGPTQTQALLPGSPAIDAGNPSGCRDSQGNLLTTDQRGYPRHDPEDTSGCDMGAYERQSD